MLMTARTIIGAALMWCAAGLLPSTALAAQCTGTGVRNNGIHVSASTLAFGVYDPTNTIATTTTTTIIVSCNNAGRTLPPISLAISAGDSTSFTSRSMNGTGNAAGNILSYQLYNNPSYTTVWGNGTGGTVSQTGGGGALSTQTFTGYGQAAAGQYVTPGIYNDQLILTLTY